MKKILEYSEFTDREDLRKKIHGIENSKEVDIIKNYRKRDLVFSPDDINLLIAGGAMKGFSELLPMNEENEDVLWEILSEAGLIVCDREVSVAVYNFFNKVCPYYYEMSKGPGLIRPIKWINIK